MREKQPTDDDSNPKPTAMKKYSTIGERVAQQILDYIADFYSDFETYPLPSQKRIASLINQELECQQESADAGTPRTSEQVALQGQAALLVQLCELVERWRIDDVHAASVALGLREGDKDDTEDRRQEALKNLRIFWDDHRKRLLGSGAGLAPTDSEEPKPKDPALARSGSLVSEKEGLT